MGKIYVGLCSNIISMISVHFSPNSLNIVFSDELFDSGKAFSPGGIRSSSGSSLNSPIRPFVLFLNLFGAPTVMSSCSALTPIVNVNPAKLLNEREPRYHLTHRN